MKEVTKGTKKVLIVDDSDLIKDANGSGLENLRANSSRVSTTSDLVIYVGDKYSLRVLKNRQGSDNGMFVSYAEYNELKDLKAKAQKSWLARTILGISK